MEHHSLFAGLTSTAERDGIQQLVVGAVVRDGGKVLLLQRPADDFMGGIFELPSGKVESRETLDSALIREVTEETGLHVTTIGEYLGSFDYESSSGKPSRQFNFVVSIAAPEPVALTEHSTYIWAETTLEFPVTDAVKNVLEKYMNVRG
jgi:8-oxo-dGTP diphosphatase